MASLAVASVTPAMATEPMSFQLETITALSGKGHASAPVSAEVISAQGEINNDTADTFLSFLQQHLQDHDLRPVVLIHSPGGTVVGSIKLGTMFRKIGAAVIVARATAQDTVGQSHVLPGYCMSACVYAFFGGKRRVIPESSHLGIHRMAIYGHAHDPAGGDEVTRSFGPNELVTALTDYTRSMGIDPAVIDYAEQISPESIHIVTPREISRWHIGSSHL